MRPRNCTSAKTSRRRVNSSLKKKSLIVITVIGVFVFDRRSDRSLIVAVCSRYLYCCQVFRVTSSIHAVLPSHSIYPDVIKRSSRERSESHFAIFFFLFPLKRHYFIQFMASSTFIRSSRLERVSLHRSFCNLVAREALRPSRESREKRDIATGDCRCTRNYSRSTRARYSRPRRARSHIV